MSKGNAKYAFFDVETSGVHPMQHSILSIAIYVTDEHHNILGEFYEAVHPGFTVKDYKLGHSTVTLWSEDAEKVHGISWRDANKQQSPLALCRSIYSFIAQFNSRLTLVYHANASFDVRFLMCHFAKYTDKGYYMLQKFIDFERSENTMSMAREYRKHGTDIIKQSDKIQKKIDKLTGYITKERKSKVSEAKMQSWKDEKAELMNTQSLLSVPQIIFEGVSLDKLCKALELKLDHHNAKSDARVLVDIHKFLASVN